MISRRKVIFMDIDPREIATEIEELERSCDERERHLQEQYPEVFKELLKIQADRGRIIELKDDLKSLLINRDDLDTYQVDGHKFSVSKIIKLEAQDMDKIPADFKAVREVADEKKAQDYYKLMGTPPEGFKDKSYHRLNWKEL